MKRTLAFLLLLVLAVGLVACADETAPDGMICASTNSAKFNLYVPEGWFSQAEDGISGALAPLGDANVIVTTHLLEEDYGTPAAFWQKRCEPEYAAYLPEFALVEAECGEAIMGGINAQKYVFTMKKGNATYKYQQLIILDYNMAYVLQYTAELSVYGNYADDVASIVSNFALR